MHYVEVKNHLLLFAPVFRVFKPAMCIFLSEEIDWKFAPYVPIALILIYFCELGCLFAYICCNKFFCFMCFATLMTKNRINFLISNWKCYLFHCIKFCRCNVIASGPGTEFMGEHFAPTFEQGGHNIFCHPQYFVIKKNVVVQISWLQYITVGNVTLT